MRRFAAPISFGVSPCICKPCRQSTRSCSVTSAMIITLPAGVSIMTVTTGSSVCSSSMTKVMSSGCQGIRNIRQRRISFNRGDKRGRRQGYAFGFFPAGLEGADSAGGASEPLAGGASRRCTPSLSRNSTPACSKAALRTVRVARRGVLFVCSNWRTVTTPTPAFAASSSCVHSRSARAARHWEAVIVSIRPLCRFRLLSSTPSKSVDLRKPIGLNRKRRFPTAIGSRWC